MTHVMKRSVLTGLCLFPLLVSCQPSAPDSEAAAGEARELRTMIREEVRAVLREELDLEQATAGMREQIQDLILEEVREQLSQRDWDQELGSEQMVATLEKLQRQARAGGGSMESPAVDLAGLTTNRAKINRILQEFEGATFYSSSSPLLQQLRDLGPAAKKDLFAALRETSTQSWAARKALSDALSPLLSSADRELFLEDARSENPALLARASALNIEEVGDEALQKLVDAPYNQFINFDLINAALHFHQEEAAAIILDHITNGGSNIAFLAQNLRRQMPDLPMRDALASAAQRAERNAHTHERHALAPMLLAEGILQGLPFAADALLDGEHNHWQTEARSAIRRYVNVVGSDEDIAAYLLANRHNLRWNPNTRIFEEIQPSGFFE
jgi:hypothetical protein